MHERKCMMALPHQHAILQDLDQAQHNYTFSHAHVIEQQIGGQANDRLTSKRIEKDCRQLVHHT